MNIPTIRAKNLALIPIQPLHAEILHDIYRTDGVLRYFPNTTPPLLEKIQRFITGQQEHWEKFGYGNWGILPDSEKEIIGWAGLQFLPELNETEVDFLMDKPFWGKGYGTEAARASLQFGFDHFDFPHLIALVHPDNLASRRVIEKCGMSYVETMHLWGMDLMRHCIERKI
ncbi:MAG: GNAT family N-acetyltransferase [Chloroflexi bacterium]|nr:GNAT family N-acetyltransferase [Chloroflexota bacterium]